MLVKPGRTSLGTVVLLLVLCAGLLAQDNVPSSADAVAPDDTASGGVFSWEVLRSSSYIGLIIAALAFALLTLVIYYVLTLRHGVFIPTHLLTEVAEAMKGGQAVRVMEICQTDASLLSRALAAGLNRRRDGYDDMIEAVEDVGQEESMRLHQNVGYLALIGTVSPMLGLLGTVYGMIDSFRTVAEQAGYLQPGRLAG
ncbi:MAG TPA: MotA/TolQ/ExbB proton channel family protein, partial [Planctomycetota bacterium]|nr:MotA/TolQ/ExbB proton channel family protein [Planctomycetota bacterium]